MTDETCPFFSESLPSRVPPLPPVSNRHIKPMFSSSGVTNFLPTYLAQRLTIHVVHISDNLCSISKILTKIPLEVHIQHIETMGGRANVFLFWNDNLFTWHRVTKSNQVKIVVKSL